MWSPGKRKPANQREGDKRSSASPPDFLTEPDPELAWLQFVEACMPTIDRAAARAIHDEDHAVEVAAEVLERLHKDWPQILRRYQAGQGRASFFVWLAVVSRNHAIDVLRQRFGRRSIPRPIARLSAWEQHLWKLVWLKNHSLVEAGRVLEEKGLIHASAEELASAIQRIEAAIGQRSSGSSLSLQGSRNQPNQLQDEGAVAQTESSNQHPASPPNQVQQRQTHHALEVVLREFNTAERFLIRAYFLEGSTAAGVAAACGMEKADQVYQRVKEIMLKLRQLAEANDLGPEDCASLASFDWQAVLSDEQDALE